MGPLTTSPGRAAPGLLTHLRGVIDELNPAEAKLGRYVLQQPHKTLSHPVEALAAAAEVSTATVVRFCRSLGFDGLRDFRLSLAMELNRRAPPPPGAMSVAQRILQANIQALQETVNLLDGQAVERAASALATAPNVAAFAHGLSMPIALDAAHRLQRLGLNAVYFPEAYHQRVRASNLRPGDVALLISHSGRTTLTLECAHLAAQSGATLLVLTSAPRSALAEAAHIALVTATTEAQQGEEALSSRLAHLALVDILCGTLQESDPERFGEALRRARVAERSSGRA